MAASMWPVGRRPIECPACHSFNVRPLPRSAQDPVVLCLDCQAKWICREDTEPHDKT